MSLMSILDDLNNLKCLFKIKLIFLPFCSQGGSAPGLQAAPPAREVAPPGPR